MKAARVTRFYSRRYESMANMREKYESLSVAALKDLAKARGLKNMSALKKAEVVDAMVAEDRRLEQIRSEERRVGEEGWCGGWGGG